jgi:hypothetical protein
MRHVRRRTSRSLRTKKGEYLKGKANEIQTVRTKISEIYREVEMILRRVTNLELSYYNMRMMICLPTSTVFLIDERIIFVRY